MYNYTNLPLDRTDPAMAVMVDTALAWVEENTTIELDPNAELPANVKLFVMKFCDVLTHTTGVASESLGGMSQSFTTSNGTAGIIADLATQLFGSAYKGRNRFVTAQRRWR